MLASPKSNLLHFIGIGGIGMSGIAQVLLDLGYKVSGSDLNHSSVTENLINKGATIFKGHHPQNVQGATIIIYSSAIDEKNPEVIRARELGIPMIKRAEMLAELMRLKYGIAVAGSHGKTTTTSLIATIFDEAQQDATHIIGGIVSNLGGNARKGNGNFLIAEADESDGSFLLLNPVMSAVTNIDNDHLDYYGTKEQIVEAFVEFLNKVPFYGKVVLNADDKVCEEIRFRIKRPVIWYGISKKLSHLEYVADEISLTASGAEFNLIHNNQLINRIKTNLLGMHNISNTLAAIAISHQAGLDFNTIQNGLLKFAGVNRRLERLHGGDDFLVIDDYGHHPTEIKATIKAIKDVDQRPLCVIFEPHRYSRTKNFWTEFQEAFEGVEEIYISPIYSASESPIEGISSERLVEEMKTKNLPVNFLPELNDMKTLLQKKKSQKGIFLTLGAGTISKKIRELVKSL